MVLALYQKTAGVSFFDTMNILSILYWFGLGDSKCEVGGGQFLLYICGGWVKRMNVRCQFTPLKKYIAPPPTPTPMAFTWWIEALRRSTQRKEKQKHHRTRLALYHTHTTASHTRLPLTSDEGNKHSQRGLQRNTAPNGGEGESNDKNNKETNTKKRQQNAKCKKQKSAAWEGVILKTT